jgi:hypothetical protein
METTEWNHARCPKEVGDERIEARRFGRVTDRGFALGLVHRLVPVALCFPPRPLSSLLLDPGLPSMLSLRLFLRLGLGLLRLRQPSGVGLFLRRAAGRVELERGQAAGVGRGERARDKGGCGLPLLTCGHALAMRR